MSLTLIIIIATCVVSIPAFKNREFFYKYDFSPYQVEHRKEWYRFITHAFLHADGMHLFFNMFVLFMFGNETQRYFQYYTEGKGIFYFLLLYFGGILVAVVPTFKKHKDNPNYHSIGASGAVSSVLFSFVVFSPATELCLYGLPFLCFPGILWAVIYLAYSYYQSKNGKDHINHDAHLWGAIWGVVFTALSVPSSVPLFFDQISGLLNF